MPLRLGVAPWYDATPAPAHADRLEPTVRSRTVRWHAFRRSTICSVGTGSMERRTPDVLEITDCHFKLMTLRFLNATPLDSCRETPRVCCPSASHTPP